MLRDRLKCGNREEALLVKKKKNFSRETFTVQPSDERLLSFSFMLKGIRLTLFFAVDLWSTDFMLENIFS